MADSQHAAIYENNRLETWLKDDHERYANGLECRNVEVFKHESFGSLMCKDAAQSLGAGRGMFSREDVPAGGTLLSIPATALLNPLSLSACRMNTIPSHLFPLSNHTPPVRTPGSTDRTSSKSAITPPLPKRKRLSIASRLNTTQLLTLHLLLTLDPAKRHPSAWERYIATLPTFESHPLSWLYENNGKGEWSWYGDVEMNGPVEEVGDEVGRGADERSLTIRTAAANANGQEGDAGQNTGKILRSKLLSSLTRAARAKLGAVQERYEGDKAAILTVLRAEQPFKEQRIINELSEQDLLWAWLNVNTRSVSIPLGLPNDSQHTQNHTLVPILDMLNHSSDPGRIIPTPRQIPATASTSAIKTKTGPAPPRPRQPLPQPAMNGSYTRNASSPHLVPGRIDLRLVAPSTGIKAGQEVMFEYGPHCSATLFAEYGFSELTYIGVKRDLPGSGPAAKGMNGCDSSGTPSGSSSGGSGHSRSRSGGKERSDVLVHLSDPANEHREAASPPKDNSTNLNWRDLRHSQLDIGYLVEQEWDRIEDEEKEEKIDALRVIGCYQRNTLHASPSPPHPSHSLLMTLRLLFLPSPIPSLRLRAIRSGSISYFGPEVESRVSDMLRTMCERVVRESAEGMERVQGLKRELEGVFRSRGSEHELGPGSSSRHGSITGNVSLDERSVCEEYTLLQLGALWEEQKGIAQAIVERIKGGDTDW